MVHDMALYRQSRVALEKEEKKAKVKAFFILRCYRRELFWRFLLLSKKIRMLTDNGSLLVVVM
ncbi:MAG: hypothetical protein O4861_12730 [Trichodesmium sp. St16_bin4-tuft]|nr:hypothetical protein [Trichodesmium sp. MAG_R01]MDE5071024.1 hypothetical protein [Trichodesmium sp. St5_bin8]MDE5099149.1 hypothetical protein [Trichodesmium sp. St16_bin4-tuft]